MGYSMMREATTRPVWLRVWQSAQQASAMRTVVAMQKAVEMHIAEKAGVTLTIRQLRDAAVYTVTYDEENDRELHEVFAPFGITYQPAEAPR
ncbi:MULTISPECIES: hypothetical protein [Kribbella]|uniref:hypothetical protein n=1 Tax=Kribbella TaxID=182639 RepID=UPI0010450CF9|nr:MULTISPECIES: hypothetical protein [Kribbella]